MDIAPGHDSSVAERLLDGEGVLGLKFQPIMDFDSAQIVACEALLRAQLDGEHLAPPEVLASASACDRIRDLGRHVMEEACAAAATWRAHGTIGLMVNVDATELLDPRLHLDVAASLDRSGLSAELLSIEITETALISDSEVASRNLHELRALGVGVALDDFGTGFASLSHLRTVPITSVKLDRLFINGVHKPGLDFEIVRGVVRLAHALGLRTIAEGVETEQQRVALQGLGCDEWQGFLRAAALDAEDFRRELDDQRHDDLAHRAADAPTEPERPVDTFVLRRIASRRWAHLGGTGRGVGWAGIVEIDEETTPAIAEVLATGFVRFTPDDVEWVFGAYHTAEAVLVRVDADTVVVFGAPHRALLPSWNDQACRTRAEDAASEVSSVSPAKRLADELELSEALHSLVSSQLDTLDEAMRHVVDHLSTSLSCEFGLIYLRSAKRVVFYDTSFNRANQTELMAALDEMLDSTMAPRCAQDASKAPLPDAIVDNSSIRSWLAIPLSAELDGIIVCAHSDRQPRGFTSLCQRLGNRLADAAELVLGAGVERERLNARADAASLMARVDSMTGLLNRRGWEVALSELEPDHPFSAIIVDANDLKLINDNDGHAAGDEIIMLISSVLTQLSRSSDAVARLGGDEFGLLLPRTTSTSAALVERRLIETFDLERAIHPKLSIAHGAATQGPNEAAIDVIARADRLMYEAKRASREASRVHTP